ncbi:high molecular weight rubredoxin [Peptococcaceae bacterium CEB3]|nr:high molecular weight rubredoxin [Peptococcaceae bacterium CEB3]
MKQWRCTICGYVHTGETPPEVCPVCGADSSFFEEVTGEAGEGGGLTGGEPLIKGGPKQALHKITYGLFIVSSLRGEEINAQCANTVFQITSEPATVAIGINKNNYTHDFIEASGVVGISILDCQGQNLARRFGYRSGRDADKFAGIPYRTGVTGVPLPDGCLGFLEGKVRDKLDCGTHTLYLLDVVNGGLYSDEEPMTYSYFRASK